MSTDTKNQPPAAAAPSTQNPFAGFDPMTAWAQGQAQIQQMMADAFGRMTSFATEYTTMESQFLAKAQDAMKNFAQLSADALAYGAQLSAQARQVGLEHAKQISNLP
ncbi:hypothetical protein BH11MYX1_BH11MYX1_11460 [soil metagenome]